MGAAAEYHVAERAPPADAECTAPGEWWVWMENANEVRCACTLHVGAVIAALEAWDVTFGVAPKGYYVNRILKD